MTFTEVKNRALDILFPRRCPWCDRVLGFSSAACSCEARRAATALPAAALQPRFGSDENQLDALWACYLYEEPVRSAIHRMKFEGQSHLAAPLGQRLAACCRQVVPAGSFDMLVPVPASPKRLKSRGYNQSALMADEMAKQLGVPCTGAALRKVRHTRPQMELNRAGRLQNLRGAFVADGVVAMRRVLLVDDIVTTGSTLNECAAALRAAGAGWVGALCLASAEKRADEDD